MDLGLIVTLVGITVAALAGVLGVWMERDRETTVVWPTFFSMLIGVAMFIEMGHAVIAQIMDWKVEETMAEVLERLDEVASKSDNPELRNYVDSEIAAQSRSNPRVVKKLDRRIAAKGGDPGAVHARAAEARKGGKREGKAPPAAPAPTAPTPAPGAPGEEASAESTGGEAGAASAGSAPAPAEGRGGKAKAGKAKSN